jgi:hypothetical protein
VGPDRAREEALLASTTRAFLDDEPVGEALALAAPPLDWDWIVRRAEVERLAALLYTVVHALPLPGAVLDRLRAAWVSGQRQHLLGIEQLSEVLSAFEREGLPALTLKGPALGEALYRDPGLRPFTDLDLFVHAADVPRAVSLLSALGYRHLDAGHSLGYELAWRHSACFVGAEGQADRLPVDLHWGLLDYPGIARGPSMDPEEVWERAVKVGQRDQPARGLCPEDLLIYLALHWAVHHAFSGFIWRLDLALLLRRSGDDLDWEAAAERARRWRVAGMLYFALREVEEQFAVGSPAAFLARLRPRGLRPALLDRLRRRKGERLERLDYLIPVLLMDRGSDVLRALGGAALPAAGWARFRYGKESLLGAYLAHYGRIGRVCLRTVRATLAR